MDIRNAVAIASLFAALSLPVSSHAATDRDAIEACSDALARKIETQQGMAPKVSIADIGASLNHRVRSDTIYHLDAFEPVSKRLVARVDCTVTRGARVKSLRMLPLTSRDARERARGWSLRESKS